MVNAKDFIVPLYDEFTVLERLLKNILAEEALLEKNILVKSGFLIRRYSLKISALKKEALSALRRELERVSSIEQQITYDYKQAEKNILEIEKTYNAYKGAELPLSRVFTEYMNNAFYTAKLCIVRIDEIIKFLDESKSLHPEESGGEVHKVLLSLEKMTNQILRFITLLSQLSKKVAEFEADTYFPNPRLYGRVMSDDEFKRMKESNTLSSGQNPTPVFDSPLDVTKRIFSMSKNEREVFFRAIGVRSMGRLVIFQTRLKPVVGPVPQTNGLSEYKFPKNIPIEILQAA